MVLAPAKAPGVLGATLSTNVCVKVDDAALVHVFATFRFAVTVGITLLALGMPVTEPIVVRMQYLSDAPPASEPESTGGAAQVPVAGDTGVAPAVHAETAATFQKTTEIADASCADEPAPSVVAVEYAAVTLPVFAMVSPTVVVEVVPLKVTAGETLNVSPAMIVPAVTVEAGVLAAPFHNA